MSKYLIIPILSVLISTYDTKAQIAMTAKQLDSLCQAMSDEYRLCIPIEVTDGAKVIAENETMNNSFVSYLHNAYYTKGKRTLTATQKQGKEGVILRLSEGRLTIEEVEDFRCKGKFISPTEMVETEYFFLNNRLVKVSITIGRTDYNAIPSNFWIIVNQIDFVYHDAKPEKKVIYFVSNHASLICRVFPPINVMSNEEWREELMNYANITEDKLKAKAYQLYTMYTVNKNLFNHQE